MSDQESHSDKTDASEQTNKENTPQAISLWAVAKSVLSAMIGIQSAKNRERDFTQGKPHQYVIIGILAVFLFIAILVTIVSIVS